MKSSFRFALVTIICFNLLISCATDDDSGATITTLTFTHYSTISFGFSNTPRLLPLSTKSGESSSFYRFVEGFDYEPGFDYEVRVLETPNDPDLQDAPRFSYDLIEVISKTPGSTSEKFDVWLGYKSPFETVAFVTGDATTGFQLLNNISIDCTTMCDELNVEQLEESTSLAGTFTRNSDNTYVLVSTFIQ